MIEHIRCKGTKNLLPGERCVLWQGHTPNLAPSGPHVPDKVRIPGREVRYIPTKKGTE